MPGNTPDLPAELTAMRTAKDAQKKAAFLQAYTRSPQIDHDLLVKALRIETAETDSAQWKEYCNKFIQWAGYQKMVKNFSFNPKEILGFLSENRPLDQKFGIIQLALPHLTQDHQKIIVWFEKNLHSEDPNIRNSCKRVLEYLTKKGVWKQKQGLTPEDSNRLSFQQFMALGREEALIWLQETEENPQGRPTFLEWGPSALLLSTNVFIVSKLLKVTSTYFLQYQMDPARILGLISGYLRHEDDRVRANSIEAIAGLSKYKLLMISIMKTLQEGLEDTSPRVKAMSAILLHPMEPDETSRRVGLVIADVKDEDELEGVEWALSGSNFLELHSDQIKRVKIRLEKMKEKDWVAGGWQG
ncbi:HEAT repeat domain-containing protein [bacterium]|jgi:hypothetical protein|nr:HEAT repeat domain-containing protein [bacterium]